MAPISVTHHHRSTTKVDNKPFKARHATKSALRDRAKGKVEDGDRGKRRTPHQQVMNKFARKNQARQKLIHQHKKKEDSDKIFHGREGAPKHVAVVPLSASVDIRAAVKELNDSVDVRDEVSHDGVIRAKVDRFRRNLLYIPVRQDIMSALDACSLADFVLLLMPMDQAIDDAGDMILRAIESQGIPNVLALAQGKVELVALKKHSQLLSSLKTAITHYFPALDKVHSLENKSDCANLVRTLCTAATKGIRWRDERSWMLIEEVSWPQAADQSIEKTEAVVTGVVRGKPLSPDRLVHIPGWGDLQMESISVVPTQSGNRKGEVGGAMDMETQIEYGPTADQDDMAAVAPEEAMTDDVPIQDAAERKGVLLDDHHYFSDDDTHIPEQSKRLPKGTSSYQAAWYLDDVSDSGSDLVDEEDRDGDVAMDANPADAPEDGVALGGQNPDEGMTEAGPSEYPQSEMFLDPSPDDEATELEAYRTNRRKEVAEDLEFPDEIELHPNVLARERLARYRGLKSLRTSEWATDEDRPYEPTDWSRLLQIADYKRSKNQVLREALVGPVAPGTKVSIRLRDVPTPLQTTCPHPISLFSLLRHEHKSTVVNLSLSLSSTAPEPLKSKGPLLVQIGPRRLLIRPIFSSLSKTPNDVHKFDRYLHPGRTAVATFIGPLTWGSIPCLAFRPIAHTTTPSMPDSHRLFLVGTATTNPTPPGTLSRVIAKRVILTGHPYKIHKRLVTVRYMFFNAEDVGWFKALQLWTRRGRTGFIKESLGTHGYFKATFDGRINPQDAVGISLYKRVFPRWAEEWRG